MSMSGCPTNTPIAFNTPVRGSTAEAGWSDPTLPMWFDNSDVACDPFGRDYPAPYQVYSLPIPDHSAWDIVVNPDPGVDVSLVGWLQGGADDTCHPERGISVITCEVSNFEGAGGRESIYLNAINNPYNIHILVATPPGGTPGGFELRVVNAT